MKETTIGKDVGKERYSKRFIEALPKWQMWREIHEPALSAIKMSPALDKEQRMMVTKEYLKRFHEGLAGFQMGILLRLYQDLGITLPVTPPPAV